MARNYINYTHGDKGIKPSDGYQFNDGERPDASNFDWYWYTVTNTVDQLWSEFERIDSDDDGIVDTADYANDADASTYKSNDIDSNGDGVVDEADYANDSDASTYKGNDIDSDGDGIVDEADYASDADASTYKGNDIDSDGDGTVDSADVSYNVETRTTDPSSPSDGRMWLRTDL